MTTMYAEKAAQAERLLEEVGLDCWLTFVRETAVTPDPGVEMVVGANVTWPSAFLFARGGVRIAIVGRYDTAAIRPSGVFHEIIGYDEGIRAPLLAVLEKLNPGTIGLNYSIDDKTSDGLTYGMWLLLNEMMADTPFATRLTSAGPLLTRLRARKTPAEVARIQAAITTTEEIVSLISQQIQVGKSEAQIGAFVHNEFQRRGLPSAWAWDACPIVNSGPESEPGHAGPRDDIHVEPGHLVHIDLGVQQEGYCSDIQRMWYVRRPGEDQAPPEIQRAFETVLQAIDASAAALRPVRGRAGGAVLPAHERWHHLLSGQWLESAVPPPAPYRKRPWPRLAPGPAGASGCPFDGAGAHAGSGIWRPKTERLRRAADPVTRCARRRSGRLRTASHGRGSPAW